MGLLKKSKTVHLDVIQSSLQDIDHPDIVNYEQKVKIGIKEGYPTQKSMVSLLVSGNNSKLPSSTTMKEMIRTMQNIHDYGGRSTKWGYTFKMNGTSTELDINKLKNDIGASEIIEYQFGKSDLYTEYLLWEYTKNSNKRYSRDTRSWKQWVNFSEIMEKNGIYQARDYNDGYLKYKIRPATAALHNFLQEYVMENYPNWICERIPIRRIGGNKNPVRPSFYKIESESGDGDYSEWLQDPQYLVTYTRDDDNLSKVNLQMQIPLRTVDKPYKYQTINVDVGSTTLINLGYTSSEYEYMQYLMQAYWIPNYRNEYNIDDDVHVEYQLEEFTTNTVREYDKDGDPVYEYDEQVETTIVNLKAMGADDKVNSKTIHEYYTLSQDKTIVKATRDEYLEYVIANIKQIQDTITIFNEIKNKDEFTSLSLSDKKKLQDKVELITNESDITFLPRTWNDVLAMANRNPKLASLKMYFYVEYICKDVPVDSGTLESFEDEGKFSDLITIYYKDKNGNYKFSCMESANDYYIKKNIQENFMSKYRVYPAPEGYKKPYFDYNSGSAADRKVKRNKKTLEDAKYLKPYKRKYSKKDKENKDLHENLATMSNGWNLREGYIFIAFDLVPFFLKEIREDRAYRMMLKKCFQYFENTGCVYTDSLSSSTGVRYINGEMKTRRGRFFAGEYILESRYFQGNRHYNTHLHVSCRFGLFWKACKRHYEGKFDEENTCYIGVEEDYSLSDLCLYLNVWDDPDVKNGYTTYVLDFKGFLTYGTYQWDTKKGNIKGGMNSDTKYGNDLLATLEELNLDESVLNLTSDDDDVKSIAYDEIPAHVRQRKLEGTYTMVNANVVSYMPLKLWWKIPYCAKVKIHGYSQYLHLRMETTIKVSTTLGKMLGGILIVVGTVLTSMGYVDIGSVLQVTGAAMVINQMMPGSFIGQVATIAATLYALSVGMSNPIDILGNVGNMVLNAVEIAAATVNTINTVQSYINQGKLEKIQNEIDAINKENAKLQQELDAERPLDLNKFDVDMEFDNIIEKLYNIIFPCKLLYDGYSEMTSVESLATRLYNTNFNRFKEAGKEK